MYVYILLQVHQSFKFNPLILEFCNKFRRTFIFQIHSLSIVNKLKERDVIWLIKWESKVNLLLLTNLKVPFIVFHIVKSVNVKETKYKQTNKKYEGKKCKYLFHAFPSI